MGDILGELVKGGLKQQTSTGRRKSSGKRKKDNPLGEILEQMMGGSRRPSGRSRDYQDDSQFGGDNPLGEIFENMLGQKRGRYQPERQTQPSGGRSRRKTGSRVDDFNSDDPDNSFEDIGSSERYDEPVRRPRRAPQKRGGGLEDLFGDMFEAGARVDDGYQNDIESILEKLMKR